MGRDESNFRKGKTKREMRSIKHEDTFLSTSLTQEESHADIIWRDSPPDSPVIEENDCDALRHILKPQRIRKRIRVERVEDVTPIVTQSTQHMNEFTNMLSQLPRSTSTSAIKSPQTNTETSFGTASTKRTATRSVITPRSLPTSHHSGITTQCTPSTRSPCDKIAAPHALDSLTADDLNLISEMEKSAEQYFTQLPYDVKPTDEGSGSPFIDYDQLESVMQAAEEKYTQKLHLEATQVKGNNMEIESVTVDEWSELEALEMAAVQQVHSQSNFQLSPDNWLNEITSIQCIRLRAFAVQDVQDGAYKVVTARREYLLDEALEAGKFLVSDETEVTVELWDDWCHTYIHPGDVFHVINFNTLSSSCSSYRVDKSSSLLILCPDVLLTPTKIAEACDCSRRMVLADRYRGLNGDLSPLAVMGNVKHDFIEIYVDRYLNLKSQGVTFDSLSQNDITDIRTRAISNNCADLYTCKFTDEEVTTALQVITPLVAAWARDGIRSLEAPLMSRVQGSVHHAVEGKEDEVWCPMLGIKGNIDMIIRTHDSMGAFVTPVELKTGKWRPNTAVGHRAQAILYVILLLFRERNAQSSTTVPGALLLYINAEGNVTETKSDYIIPKWCDIKALMQSRNNLASYLSRLNDAKSLSKAVSLPPMIMSPSTCGSCFQAAECMHYHKAIEGGDEASSGVPELFHYITSALLEDDISYLKHWEHLLDLENASAVIKSRQSQIWTAPAMLKMKHTSGCMPNMMFIKCVCQRDNCILTFHPILASSSNSWFDIGDSVAVSVETSIGDIEDLATVRNMWDVAHTEPHIVSGHVVSTNGNAVELSVSDEPKRLRRMIENVSNGRKTFRLDRTSYATNLSTVRSNMYRLFSSGHNVRRYNSRNKSDLPSTAPRSTRLRELIVLLKPPIFSPLMCDKISLFKPPNVSDEVFSKVLKILHKKREIKRAEESMIICGVRIHVACNPLSLAEEYRNLNEDQRNAVDKVLMADDYVLLQGFPGTGKTQTVAFVIRALVARNQHVLVTSYTHSAVDHLLEKLVNAGMQPAVVIRIGTNSKLAPGLEKYSLQAQDTTAIAHLTSRLADIKVVMCTVLSAARNSIVQSRSFDWTVMDESGQISHPASIGPLLLSKRMLMVGDTHQLPPLVVSKEAKAQGLEESLFKYLADHHPAAVVALSIQYRMNNDILTLCNEVVYGNRLRCGSEDVALARLNISLNALTNGTTAITSTKNWLLSTIHPNSSAIFLNTDQLSNNGSLGSPEYDFERLKDRLRMRDVQETWAVNGKELLLQRRDVGSISGVVNPSEAIIVYYIVKALQQCGIDVAADVGVMSPYRAQVALIDSLLCQIDSTLAGVACTIDKFQGRDKDVIILSTVRSNNCSETGELLRDWRRINVAITRAKRKLIVIGSCNSAEKIPILRQLVIHMVKRNWILNLPKQALESDI